MGEGAAPRHRKSVADGELGGVQVVASVTRGPASDPVPRLQSRFFFTITKLFFKNCLQNGKAKYIKLTEMLLGWDAGLRRPVR